jgi:hypothetical protein
MNLNVIYYSCHYLLGIIMSCHVLLLIFFNSFHIFPWLDQIILVCSRVVDHVRLVLLLAFLHSLTSGGLLSFLEKCHIEL